jgi:hypothetical protein
MDLQMDSQIDNNLPDPILLNLNIDEQLSCAVCTSAYYNPITLLCQHTFCYHCISDEKVKECPICRVKKFIPKSASDTITDNILNKITKIYYGETEINKMKDYVEDYLDEKKTKPAIEKEMETTLIANLNDLAVATSQTTPQIPVGYAGLIQSVSSGANNISVNLHNNNDNSIYKKICKYAMFLIYLFISGFLGWNAGSLIAEIFNYIKGRGSLGHVLYLIMITYITYLAVRHAHYKVECEAYTSLSY